MRRVALLGVAVALSSQLGCVVPWAAPGDTGVGDTDDNGSTDQGGGGGGGGADTDIGNGKPPHLGSKPADTCKASKDFGTLKEGTFSGNFGNYTASGFEPDCGATFVAPQGIDGFYRIDLAPKQSVTVHFSIPNEDVVIYLVDGCTAQADCVDSADAGRVGGEEGMTYRNAGDAPQTVYLGVALYYATSRGGTFSITTSYTP